LEVLCLGRCTGACGCRVVVASRRIRMWAQRVRRDVMATMTDAALRAEWVTGRRIGRPGLGARHRPAATGTPQPGSRAVSDGKHFVSSERSVPPPSTGGNL
jgi:hypothetical protein